MATLYIKNMVCDRCKAAVKTELEKFKIHYKSIELGEIEVESLPSDKVLSAFGSAITNLGFELIEDKAARVVSQVKKNAQEWVRGAEGRNSKLKFSAYLADTMHKDYATISNLFSQVEGTTIEQYLIHQKIEMAKELLVYDELSLNQIANRLHYSSVQHLSNQFKKITGLTPTHFKKIGASKRVPLDKL